MSILDRIKKSPAKKTAPAKVKAEKAAPEKTEAVVASGAGLSKTHAFTLVKPHVSEKAARLADTGVYVFDVPVDANKVEIRKAVEAQYSVNVIGVRTIRGIGKPVRRGKSFGRRNRWKKALVELKKGQTLNLVEGV